LPRRLQLPIALGLNLPLMPGEHVLWRDVADGAVQSNDVVMRDVTVNQTPRIGPAVRLIEPTNRAQFSVGRKK